VDDKKKKFLLPEEKRAEEYLDNLWPLLPDIVPLKEYSKIFLKGISSFTLNELTLRKCAKFVEDRYNFFQESVKNDGQLKVYKFKTEGRVIVEWAFWDAVYSMDTILGILDEMGATPTFEIFKSIGVEKNEKGDIQKILPTTIDNKRMVVIYIELRPFASDAQIDQLRERLKIHSMALGLSNKHQGAIRKTVSTLQLELFKDKKLSEEDSEWNDFLSWMEENIYFVGYIPFEHKNNGDLPDPVFDLGLGLCSSEFKKLDSFGIFENLTNQSLKYLKIPDQYFIGTLGTKSPIRRLENLMRVCVRVKKGKILVEHNFLGFLRSNARIQNILETPILRVKIKEIIKRRNLLKESYGYNQTLRSLSAFPKYELLRLPLDELDYMVKSILTKYKPQNMMVVSFYREQFNQVVMIIALPKDLFTRPTIDKIEGYLEKKIPHSSYEYIETQGHKLSFLNFYFDILGEEDWTFDNKELEKNLENLIKPWDQKFRDSMIEEFSGNLGNQLADHYLPLMPNHYMDRSSPEEAVRDIGYIEKLRHQEGINFELEPFFRPGSKFHDNCSLIHIYSKDKIDLITIMPVMKNLGIYVYDQIVSRIGDANFTAAYVGSFRVVDAKKNKIDPAIYKKLLGDILSELFKGRTQDDPLNGLVLKSQLDWREVNILQCYRNLYLQIKNKYDKETVNQTLLTYPKIAKTLVEYFKAKFSFDPNWGDKEFRLKSVLPDLKNRFIDELHVVKGIAEDNILRNLLYIVEATLRTNFFIPKKNQETFISIKIDSGKIPFMPKPVPFREIYVHDVNVEGTHLRFGPIARGGLRWSDRGFDFRNEVLDLVKTQQKKNVVIVPVGSKGGFFVKKLPKNYEDSVAESRKQYKIFIQGILDITDNMDAHRKVFHPSKVMFYDESDPYLVVAADKGTAANSDLANSVSTDYDFWLGDAFASGGSVGYDHKKEGITARGAWECVKLHFKERGKDIQKERLSVAGIGDMSGDVFGNGLLLSKTIELKAAFNHIHIFLDPHPDPEESWNERDRLFKLPRSSWMDYSPQLISEGGGVFDRAAKSIPLSSQVKEMLGIKTDRLTGDELITAILKMNVELFWFGGIGTYIRSPEETDLRVGDRANDAIRITSEEMNAQVVGEGANLGMTQMARIELNQRGIQLNTDAIDNSAGVNMSDYEVNIKILLQNLLNQKKLKSMEERNKTLGDATDQVSELVLRNNRWQHRLLSMDVIRSKTSFRFYRDLIKNLIKAGMDAKSESIPSNKELKQWENSKKTLPRPVLAQIQAFVKMGVYDSFCESDLLNHPYFDKYYKSYFPEQITSEFEKELSNHPLKNQIIATVLTNKIVNQVGSFMYDRFTKFTGRGVDEISQVYLIMEECVDSAQFRHEIFNEPLNEEIKYEALIELEDLLRVLTHFGLRASKLPSFDKIDYYKELLTKVEHMISAEGESFTELTTKWVDKGFSEPVSNKLALYQQLFEGPDILLYHDEKGIPIEVAWKLSLLLNNRFKIWWFFRKIREANITNDWEYGLQDILILNLESAKYRLVDLVLAYHDVEALKNLKADQILAPIIKDYEISFKSFFDTLERIMEDPNVGLTAISVCVNGLNFLGNALIEVEKKNKN
jgi:glutamate dehydrogenase